MTCIVGLEFEGKVYMAGDIQGTGSNSKVIHTQPKVFNKNGVIFGYTTSYRFGQLLEHGLSNPIIPDDDREIYRWLITVLIPDIKAALKASDYDKGGTCLIGVKNQLWELQDDFSVLRSVRGYGACGSGYEYAMGSMMTGVAHSPINTGLNGHGYRTTGQDPIQILKLAIKVAGTFSPSVGMDSVVIST